MSTEMCTYRAVLFFMYFLKGDGSMYLGSSCTAEYGVARRLNISVAIRVLFKLLLAVALIPALAYAHIVCYHLQTADQAYIEYQNKVAMDKHYKMVSEMDAIVGASIEASNAERFEAERIEAEKAEIQEARNKATVGGGAIQMSELEKHHLVQLVFAESGSETYSDKLSVAKVVLKRVASPDYPNTVDAVIWQSCQFEPAKSNGTITDGSGNDLAKKELPNSCYEAVEQAIAECNAGDYGPYLNFYGNGTGNGNSFY